MSLPVYLALTGAEFPHKPENYQNLAYMACHFSPYGTGLSNIPRQLPPECLLILNDRIPPCGHCPEHICRELAAVTERFQCGSVLLDFQRTGDGICGKLAELAVASLPCPVAVTEGYAGALDCPVFVSPPLYITPEASIARWKNREIWLELGFWSQTLTLTEDGCAIGPMLPVDARDDFFLSEQLCCGYRVEVLEDRAVFTLQRNPEHLQLLLERCNDSRVTRAVGLHQEIGQYFDDFL